MRLCIVIPVYNHGAPLARTVAGLMPYALPILIVDDGSDAANKETIAATVARHGVQLLTLPQNGGKGCAVKAGLHAAWQNGFSHALQIDADGQHDLADIPRLIAAARQHPAALVSGVPRFDASAPASRVHGRKLTNFWVHIETLSFAIADAMCGFRVYPLAPFVDLMSRTRLGDRMEFDIEVAVRLYWSGVPFIALPTSVIYPEDGSSNFRLVRDNWTITKLHTRLFFGMLPRLPMLLGRRFGLVSTHWSRLGERGGVLGMGILFGAYRLFGRWAFAALLYPVMAYFYLAAGNGRRASRDYLARIRARAKELDRPVDEKRGTYGHFIEFGNALLDKGAMWAGKFPVESIEFDDPAVFRQFRLENRGSIFIGSHLGNLEVLRAFGETVQGMTVHALVFTRHSAKFTRMLSAVNPRVVDNMIQVDSLGPESVVKLADKIRAGEHVAIVGDRTSVRHEERSIRADFLGSPAPFPEGPFILASLLACPVYLLFCLKRSGKYRIYLEKFADPLVLPRAERREALEQAITRYARRLEAYCLLAPTQWYNFFDFWGEARVR